MERIFFTSDLHLGHANVIRFQNRPFADVEEMNKTLICNYNSVVQKEDTVYILGDLAYRISADEANTLISRLNGRKYLILGNHDRQYDESLFEEITHYKEIHELGQQFILMHYPIMDWNRMRYGSIHLHGHIHSVGDEYNFENLINGIRRYDVGVDANNYYPVPIQKIIDFFDNEIGTEINNV